MMVMIAVVRLAVGITENLFICMLGCGIFGVGSGGGVISGCGGSSLTHHQHHHYHHHSPRPSHLNIALLQL